MLHRERKWLRFLILTGFLSIEATLGIRVCPGSVLFILFIKIANVCCSVNIFSDDTSLLDDHKNRYFLVIEIVVQSEAILQWLSNNMLAIYTLKKLHF